MSLRIGQGYGRENHLMARRRGRAQSNAKKRPCHAHQFTEKWPRRMAGPRRRQKEKSQRTSAVCPTLLMTTLAGLLRLLAGLLLAATLVLLARLLLTAALLLLA